MPGPFSKKGQKGQLCPAVALPEGMNGVELSQKMRGLPCEGRRIHVSKMPFCRQMPEQSPHFAIDVLGISKHAPLFCDAHGTNPTRPYIYVLEEMSMNGAIVAVTQSSGRQRLPPAVGRGEHFRRHPLRA